MIYEKRRMISEKRHMIYEKRHMIYRIQTNHKDLFEFDA